MFGEEEDGRKEAEGGLGRVRVRVGGMEEGRSFVRDSVVGDDQGSKS